MKGKGFPLYEGRKNRRNRRGEYKYDEMKYRGKGVIGSFCPLRGGRELQKGLTDMK